MFKRISIFLYGVVSYAIFFATFLYALGFVGNFVVPRTIDGEPLLPLPIALAIDVGRARAVRVAAQPHGAPLLQTLAHEVRCPNPPSAAPTCSRRASR